MAASASLLILVAFLVNIPKCSADNFFPFKWEDSKGDYTINIDYIDQYYKALKITHDKGLVVINLTTFPAQNISRKIRDNELLSDIIIENCTLPDGDSFGILFKHLGIENEFDSFEGINILPQNFSLDGRFSSGFERVISLTLSKNSITKLNESVFDSLTELTELVLSGNNITEVDQNVFKKLTRLYRLDMSSNGLKSLSEGMFDNQKELEILGLSDNKLTKLTKDVFQGLSSLNYLSLGGNTASLMDDVFHYLPRLTHIILSDNMKVPYSILASQSQLVHVVLIQMNLVDGLQLSGLEILMIQSSEVINISGLSNIEDVMIEHCVLSSLNVNSFKNLNSTKKLHLPSNNISSLVEGLFNGLTKLTLLRLSNNQLKTVSKLVFRELENLIEIDLSHNYLTTIHLNAFDNNKQLTTIRLGNNQLSFKDEKTPFTHVNNLESLDLSYNKLTRIPDLVELIKLKEVKLNKNEIPSVKFSEIRRYVISLAANDEKRYTCEEKKPRMVLDQNPLKCNCGMFDFLSGTDQSQLAPVFSQEYYVSFKMYFNSCGAEPYASAQCPTGCSCEEIENESSHHMKMSCNGKKLIKLSKIEFIKATSIKLDVSNNSLEELPLIDLKLNVTFIQASYNQISKIEIGNLPPSLRGLDLSHNQFRTIASNVLLHMKSLENLEIFFFQNNPLECYCSDDTRQLIEFIDERNSITDLQGAKCDKLHDLSMKVLESICEKAVILNKNKVLEISIITVAIVVMIFVVILLLFIKHHKFIKMWLYAHGWFLRWVDEEYVDREKVYDVFISYEHSNRILAYRIMYALEKCNIFKVCLHERDFPGGARIEESVIKAVLNSRRTVVILSEDYLKSVWCEHEFHLAWNRCLAEKRKLIIAVKDGNLGNIRDEIIRSYIETHTYIESGDEWFFERLIFRLPHKRGIKNIFPIRDWDGTPLDTNESNF